VDFLGFETNKNEDFCIQNPQNWRFLGVSTPKWWVFGTLTSKKLIFDPDLIHPKLPKN